MPLDVYLLVGHRPSQSDQSEEQVFLKFPAQDWKLQKNLSEVYRQMPDPLRLVVLLSIYDKMPDCEIAKLLRCSISKIRHLLGLANSIFADACGETISPEVIFLMLESEINNIEISEEMINRVREMIFQKMFGDEQSGFPSA